MQAAQKATHPMPRQRPPRLKRKLGGVNMANPGSDADGVSHRQNKTAQVIRMAMHHIISALA